MYIVLYDYLALALVSTFVIGACISESKSKELAWHFDSSSCDRCGPDFNCDIGCLINTAR